MTLLAVIENVEDVRAAQHLSHVVGNYHGG